MRDSTEEPPKPDTPVFDCGLGAAMLLADIGFRVFPLVPGKKLPTSKGWQQWASNDGDFLALHWPTDQAYNVGIATGEHVVLDADKKKGGVESYEKLKREGKLPHTLTVQTAGGGVHPIYKAPPGVEIRNRVSYRRKDGTYFEVIAGAPGIDIRGIGGLIVGAGSTVDGVRYKIIDPSPIADLPAEIAAELVARQGKIPSGQPRGEPLVELDLPHNLTAADRFIAERGHEYGAKPGGRGWNTYKLACVIGDLGVSMGKTLEKLQAFNEQHCDPPQSEDKYEESIRNAYEYRQDEIGTKAADPRVYNVEPLPAQRLTTRMSEIEEKQTTWFWYPYIAAGCVTLVGAKGGTGKGIACMSIAAAVTKHNFFPASTEKAPQGTVLWCEAEDDPNETLKPRAIAAGADCDKIELLTPKNFPLLNLREHILANNTKLIVLSPLQSFLDGLKEMNSEMDARRALETLLDAVRGTGCALIGICHLNKKVDLDATERVLGSVAFTNVPRSVLLLAVENAETSQARLVHAKTNIGRKGRDLLLSPVSEDGNPRSQRVRAEWSLPPEGNVDPNSIFDRRKKADRPGSAPDWLINYMRTNGATLKSKILEDGAAAGHSEAAIEGAKQRDRRIHHRMDGFPAKAIWWLGP
jgi:hypothetical protein